MNVKQNAKKNAATKASEEQQSAESALKRKNTAKSTQNRKKKRDEIPPPNEDSDVENLDGAEELEEFEEQQRKELARKSKNGTNEARETNENVDLTDDRVFWAELFKEQMIGPCPQSFGNVPVSAKVLLSWGKISNERKQHWIKCMFNHIENKTDLPDEMLNGFASPRSKGKSESEKLVDALKIAFSSNKETKGIDIAKLVKDWPVAPFSEPSDPLEIIPELFSYFKKFEVAADRMKVESESRVYLLELKSGKYIEKVCQSIPGGTQGKTYEQVKKAVFDAPNQPYDKVALQTRVSNAERKRGETMLQFVNRLKDWVSIISFDRVTEAKDREEIFLNAIEKTEISSGVAAALIFVDPSDPATGKPYLAATKLATDFDRKNADRLDSQPAFRVDNFSMNQNSNANRNSFANQQKPPCDKCGLVHKFGNYCPAQNRTCSNCKEFGHYIAKCPKPIQNRNRDEDNRAQQGQQRGGQQFRRGNNNQQRGRNPPQQNNQNANAQPAHGIHAEVNPENE